MTDWSDISIGLLIIRVVIGALMVGHGAQKLFGWFGGPGMSRTAAGFDRLGFRPPMVMAWLAMLGEAGSGVLIGTGFLFPLGVASLIGVMINAAAVHWPNGLWITKNGYEFTLVLAVVAAGLGFTGPGKYSVDRLLDLDTGGTGWGVLALIAGVATGAATLLSRRADPNRPTPPKFGQSAPAP